MVIITIVDHFSKMVYLVHLKKLPSAKEMGELMVKEVFCLHGLPVYSMTMVHSLVLDFGNNFVISYAFPSVSPQVFTLKQTAKVRKLTRRWRQSFNFCARVIQKSGLPTYPG